MENEEIKTNILVVDDSVFDLELVDWILQEKNYNTIVANNLTERIPFYGPEKQPFCQGISQQEFS